MWQNNSLYFNSALSPIRAPPCWRPALFTTDWWTVRAYWTSVTTITRALCGRGELSGTLLRKERVFCTMCGMCFCSFINQTVSKRRSLKRMLFRNSQRKVNSPCHSPGEKHSWAYSNDIRFHWEENLIAQWCSKHGERNSERGIKPVKTSMLRHCRGWN